MGVPSFEFLAFAGLAAALINISGAAWWRRIILLGANVGFILTFTRDPAQLVPLVGLLAIGYVSLKLMERYKSKPVFVALLASLIFLFCLLKKYAFIPHDLFLSYLYLTVGMSYVLFKVLHLVIDTYQEALPERVGLLSYVNYTLNFTSLVSGPIQLYPDYRRTETLQPTPLNDSTAGRAIERIIVGFFKVTVISPVLLYGHARAVTLAAQNLSAPQQAWVGLLILLLFPIYIYLNFSGYMDFVIGVARFLRLELPENFNMPFLSQDFIEFWSRWNITLSSWLKTYVYAPLLLSMMRRFPSPKVEPFLGVFSYFVAFFLIGLWHGSTWMFVVYGVLLGLGVSLNKLYQILVTRMLGRRRYRELRSHPAYAALARGLTFLWFAFSMLWFWATWQQLRGFASAFGPIGVAGTLLFGLLAAIAISTVLKAAHETLQRPLIENRIGILPYLRTAWCTVLAVIVVSVAVMFDVPAAHIVYKAF